MDHTEGDMTDPVKAPKERSDLLGESSNIPTDKDPVKAPKERSDLLGESSNIPTDKDPVKAPKERSDLLGESSNIPTDKGNAETCLDGNTYCPCAIPAWQRPITEFFRKIASQDEKADKKISKVDVDACGSKNYSEEDSNNIHSPAEFEDNTHNSDDDVIMIYNNSDVESEQSDTELSVPSSAEFEDNTHNSDDDVIMTYNSRDIAARRIRPYWRPFDGFCENFSVIEFVPCEDDDVYYPWVDESEEESD